MGVEDIIYDEIIDSMTGGDILSVGLSEKKIMAHLWIQKILMVFFFVWKCWWFWNTRQWSRLKILHEWLYGHYYNNSCCKIIIWSWDGD